MSEVWCRRVTIAALEYVNAPTSSEIIALQDGELFQPVGTAESIQDTVAVVPMRPLMLFAPPAGNCPGAASDSKSIVMFALSLGSPNSELTLM